ncbi:MAG TPA: protein translocase subunit SecD [Thermoleophilia bacterium]|nr:protein translocase subunit SecD [Thermoleophilia bacterium]
MTEQTITYIIAAVAIAIAVWAVLRKKNWVVMVMMVVLVAVSLYWIIPPSAKTRLGLDLQGGLEVVYTAKTSDGKAPSQKQLDQTVAILDRRVNGLGVTESQIQKQGSDQIAIALPGIKDPEKALSVIGKTAQLEFFKDDPASRPVGPVESKEEALKQLRREGVSKAEIAQLEAEGTSDDYSLIVSPEDTVNGVPEAWYVYKRPPAMTGGAVKSARAGFDGQTGKPNVLMEFTSDGTKQFQDVTRELYRTGLLKQTPQTFAIVLDNVMESDPMIDYTDPTLRDGISGGAEISGGSMSVQESKDLAFVLNTGALPVKLEPSYQQQVSATLGKDSMNQALIAGLIGLGLVLIYMLVYYRFLGLVADLALIVYAILLWGLFNLIPVTLTLPGIAGMILTIGVAADANVVIFERIKDEVRRGKTVRSAVSSGYARGFQTILDANVLIILTALVLFFFATAQPKGFALTLILGVLVSMLTAVLFTRAMLGVLAGFAFFNRPSLMGVKAGQVDIETAVMGDSRASASRRRRSAGAQGSAPAGKPAASAELAPADGPSAGTGGGQKKTGGRRTSTSRKRKKRR